MSKSQAPKIKHSTEKQILQRFIGTGQIPGKYEREVSLGYKADKSLKYTNPSQYFQLRALAAMNKKIDCICHTKHKGTYLIEVKGRLNPAALGQILVYDILYQLRTNTLNLDNSGVEEKSSQPPPAPPKLIILCEQTDQLVELACKKYGVKVIVCADKNK